jgi:ABC-type Na+ efflux pump permease subunit
MESVRIFFLVMFIFVMLMVAFDFIGEEKSKKIQAAE